MINKQTFLKTTLLIILIMVSPKFFATYAQSLQRPMLWAQADERDSVLQLMDDYSWAQTVVTKVKSAVDSKVNTHVNYPASILSTIPQIQADDVLSEAEATTNGGHAKVLNYASYSAMLYYITQEEKYAQFSADILAYYIDELSTRTADKTTVCGNHFYDARNAFGSFAIAYDFIYSFLTKEGTEVYSNATGSNVAFDNVKAQKVVVNIAHSALGEGTTDNKYGKMVSNHPILTAPGTLFAILCVDDDTERERLFKIFWETGTAKQNSFTKTILPMFGEQGIWPESLSYGFMPAVTLVLNMVDRLKPEMNVMADNMHILDGNFFFDYLRIPDRRFVRYGDSKRNSDSTGKLYRFTLDIANRRGFTEQAEKAKVALRQAYDANGGYSPGVSTSAFNAFSTFSAFFWAVDVPSSVEGEIDFNKKTVIVEHAGVALQRNYVEQNNVDYGLCGIIGGAHYVHSHVTGITMELYGAGYVMAPNAGLCKTLAERKLPEHTDYFWRYAGNNTIIVNGTSNGIQDGAWNSNSLLWQNTTVNIAAEPKHLQESISESFSFVTQFLDDNVNSCDQQRTLSTIRTSATTAYYFDLFRSKSNINNNFHDYIYHNIGDEMHILDEFNQDIAVTPTTMYQNDVGDIRNSPGWRFFEDTEVTDATDAAVKVRFDLDAVGRFMHMFTPAGVDRQYTKAVGPATREGEGTYLDKKTPILAVRQNGEAWDKPYLHVFEPSKSTSSSVQTVEHLYQGDVVVGAKVVSQIGDRLMTDYILCQEDANSTFSMANLGFSFTGRFAVVRQEQENDDAQLTLYIGQGDSLSFGGYTLQGGAGRKGELVLDVEPDYSRVLGFNNLKNDDGFPLGTSLSVEAFIGTDFTEVTLWANDTINMGTLTGAPYSWSSQPILTNMQDGYYTFRLEAKDALGIIEKKSIIIEIIGQKPHTEGEVPHTVPGRVQFEDYDKGGEGLAYYDLSAPDPSLYTYRDSDRVALYDRGMVVASIEKDEWLEYTIDVEETAYYDLTVRLEGTMFLFPTFSAFNVELPKEGKTLVSDFQASYTGPGEYDSYLSEKVLLVKGKQIIRFAFLNEGLKVDYFEFTKASDAYTLQVDASKGQVDMTPKQDAYAPNTKVTLTVTPEDGYVFQSWSGDYSGTENPLVITMNSHLSIVANFEQSAALENTKIDQLKISPNPSNGHFTIKLADGVAAYYQVYSMDGRAIKHGHFVTQGDIELSHEEKGVYLLEITIDQGREVKRIVVQ